jgi:hypothetical protein
MRLTRTSSQQHTICEERVSARCGHGSNARSTRSSEGSFHTCRGSEKANTVRFLSEPLSHHTGWRSPGTRSSSALHANGFLRNICPRCQHPANALALAATRGDGCGLQRACGAQQLQDNRTPAPAGPQTTTIGATVHRAESQGSPTNPSLSNTLGTTPWPGRPCDCGPGSCRTRCCN